MQTWKRNESIAELDSIINARLEKYQYNICRYSNRPDMNLRNGYEYSHYWNTPFSSWKQRADFAEPASTNVIKSCIDSIVSKLSNNKTRPFFNPVNGSYKTRQVVRQAQVYFDQVFDSLHLHDIIADAFRLACICDIGHIFIDPFTFEISNLPAWQLATLSTEGDHPTKMLIEKYNIPIMELNKYGIKTTGQKYVNFEMYIDTILKEATIFVNEQPVKSIKYESDSLPLVEVYYNKPTLGNKTTSIVDDLDSIQTTIDIINAKISASAQSTPTTTTFVQKGATGITAADINNLEGNIYELDPLPGANVRDAIWTVQQPAADPGLQQWLDYYINKAYDMVGISQLSAQSRKPSGLDSGVALQTMEDIESDRFETQVTHYTNAYVSLATKMIEILPDDLEILPSSPYNSSWTWKDVKEQSSLFKIQYSAASALSKEPSERLKQILQLTQVNLIDASKVAQYLDLPDLTDAYAGASAVSDAIDACINGAIENEVYTIPDYINYQQLSQRIALVENQLYASITRTDEKADAEAIKSLARVMSLEEVLNAKMEDEGFIQLQPTEQATADSGLAVGDQNAATQAISSADAMSNAMPNTEQQIEDNSATGLL